MKSEVTSKLKQESLNKYVLVEMDIWKEAAIQIAACPNTLDSEVIERWADVVVEGFRKRYKQNLLGIYENELREKYL